MAEKDPQSRTGVGVDANGNAVVDPTKNVLDLVEAANKRQDDLRQAAQAMAELRATHQHELGEMRAKHQRDLAMAEAQRLDSIRQVDREDVNKTAAQALAAIQTLATVTSTTAETLRTQVATTATAAANQLATITGEINKRLSALELSSSEGKGKQAYVDPQMDRLSNLVEALARAQANESGREKGMSTSWAVLLGAVSIAAAMWGIFGRGAAPAVAAPQVVYVPAPATSTAPVTAPQR
jgi:hypothetical protein